MPDNGGANGDDNHSGVPSGDRSDILSALTHGNTNANKQIKLLESIDTTLKKMLQNGNTMSMSNMRSSYGTQGRNSASQSHFQNAQSSRGTSGSSSISGAFDTFANELERQLIHGLIGVDLGRIVHTAMNKFADDIGVSLQHVPKALAVTISNKLLSGVGDDVNDSIRGSVNGLVSRIRDSYQQGVDDYYRRNPGATRPTRQSQSQARNGQGGNASPKNDNNDAANTSASRFSTKEVTIHASKVTVNLNGRREPPEPSPPTPGGPPSPDDNGSHLNEQLRQILKDNLGEDTVNGIQEESLTRLTDALQSGANAADIESYLSGLLPQGTGSVDLAGLSQTLVSALGMRGAGGPPSPGDNGSHLNEQLRQILKDNLGEDTVNGIQEESLTRLTDALQSGANAADIESYLSGLLPHGAGSVDLASLSQTLVSTLGMGGAGGPLADAAAALSGLASAAASLAPVILGVTAAFTALKLLSNALQPAIEGFKKALEAAKTAANRYNESQRQGIDSAQKRLEADVRTMVETPFKILESAAQDWYNAWDNNLRVINGTQGYNKEELQSLMSAFAERLRNENMTSVVSAADITDNLAKVLQSGLSGKVAEEFAYEATKLNAAVPTQDFFGYADTYASIAANAIRLGASEEDAIADANAQLEAFASNVLYASREVAGGFTTGLKNAESLFEQSVKIAQAGKTNNAVEISGVMTAVSAITGAIAPDLATSMTDAIYKAATGGNSSEIVALRSLAGINASNTEFLKELSESPKEVFTNLFNELAKRQSMSQDAYMEVAEGLSSIFGVSMDAFARVDFAYLAQAIANMDTSNVALSENFDLLASGETTTTAEQLKMEQINEVILDEGLAYVLDNEAARAVQQHMWDEQIARETMEATYGVELEGAALKFLEGIRETIDNILNVLIPFRALGKLSDLVSTAKEENGMEADIAQMLELGKVGVGNANKLYNLTTRNKDLNVTDSLVEMLGGSSAYEQYSDTRKFLDSFLYHVPTPWSASTDLQHRFHAAETTAGESTPFSGESAYHWGTIGKSVASALAASVPSAVSASFTPLSSLSAVSGESIETEAEGEPSKASQELLNRALSEMADFVENDTEHQYSYEDWVSSLKTGYGIKDLNQLLEENNITEEAVRGQYDALQTQAAAQEALERNQREEDFWANSTALLTTTTELLETNGTWLESMNTHAENTYKKLEEFFNSWKEYYVKHTVYNSGFTTEEYDKVVQQEKDKSDTAALALAEVLTKNNVDALLDPTLQTNVLLAEILKTVVALLAQTREAAPSLSLPDTLAGLSLGIVNT